MNWKCRHVQLHKSIVAAVESRLWFGTGWQCGCIEDSAGGHLQGQCYSEAGCGYTKYAAPGDGAQGGRAEGVAVCRPELSVYHSRIPTEDKRLRADKLFFVDAFEACYGSDNTCGWSAQP